MVGRWNVMYKDGIMLVYHHNHRIRKALNKVIYENQINIFDNTYFFKDEGKLVKVYQNKGKKERFIGEAKK